MRRDELVESADCIPQMAQENVAEFAEQRDAIVAEMNSLMLARPDLNELIGGRNTSMMEDNHRNHARFVEAILRAPDSEMLVDTVLWVFRAYRSHGFQPIYWSAQISTWQDVLKRRLSPDCYRQIEPLYEWFAINIPTFTGLTDDAVEQ